MSEPKYLLCPGPVFSKNDDQDHFITYPALAKLYGVRLDECVVEPRGHGRHGWKEPDGLIVLQPREDGNYTLPGVQP